MRTRHKKPKFRRGSVFRSRAQRAAECVSRAAADPEGHVAPELKDLLLHAVVSL